MPDGLRHALAERSAQITGGWQEEKRGYVHATAGSDRLFARYTTDPADAAVLRHEAQVRSLVGSHVPLRSPPVLDRGDTWMVEVGVGSGRCQGQKAATAAAAAAAELASRELPTLEVATSGNRLESLGRRMRTVRSPVRVRDVAAARRILSRSPLPKVLSHGDFHSGNVLPDEDGVWIVDWELLERRPAGFDLMQLWATLDAPEDRELLWDSALEVVGRENERDLADLRYALVVRTVANKVVDTKAFNRDRAGAERLLVLLEALRADPRRHR